MLPRENGHRVAPRRAGHSGGRAYYPPGSRMTPKYRAVDSLLNNFSFANRHVHFLAGLGNFLTQALMLALELARVHPEYFAQKGPVACVSFAHQLFERIFDLIRQI